MRSRILHIVFCLLLLALAAGSVSAQLWRRAGRRSGGAATQQVLVDTMRVQLQLPSVCYGDVERYGVKGQKESTYDWKIYTIVDGRRVNIVPPVAFNNGDTIEVNWRDVLGEEVPGIYTIEVKETTNYGCTGDTYSTDIVLNSNKLILPIMQEDIHFCYNGECIIDPLDRGKFEKFKDFNLFWRPDDTGGFTIPEVYYTNEETTLQVKLKGPSGCNFGSIKAIKWPKPLLDLGPDTTIYGNEELKLTAGATRFEKYEWATDNQEADWLYTLQRTSPEILVHGKDGSQRIWLTVVDENQCEARDTILVTVVGLEGVRIPAAFTPNGDGINDTWQIPAPIKGGVSMEGYVKITDVRVYDRHGKLVWSAKSYANPWDGRDSHGRPLPMDSYHYELRATVTGESRLFRGSVTIIR